MGTTGTCNIFITLTHIGLVSTFYINSWPVFTLSLWPSSVIYHLLKLELYVFCYLDSTWVFAVLFACHLPTHPVVHVVSYPKNNSIMTVSNCLEAFEKINKVGFDNERSRTQKCCIPAWVEGGEEEPLHTSRWCRWENKEVLVGYMGISTNLWLWGIEGIHAPYTAERQSTGN